MATPLNVQSSLRPGESVSGILFRSEGLPGIRPMLADGWLDREELPNVSDFEGEDATTGAFQFENPDDAHPIRGAYHGTAVGPEVLPETLSNTELCERLAKLKDQAAKLGWIKDPGIVTSLNQKLANARKALGRLFGGKKAARGILGAFVNELDALKGKPHLDDNAYYLLRANAEYLIVRLGGELPAR